MIPPYTLTLSCPDRPGIVAAVASLLLEQGFNIVDAQQFDDPETGRFFMRVVFAPFGEGKALADFELIAERFAMEWRLRGAGDRPRVLILVSKFDHCLVDLLYRTRIGELEMDIVGVVANHPREAYSRIDLGSVPFHYLPVTRDTKLEQETRLVQLVGETRADLVVLARYMQVLSDGLVGKLPGKCVNIHHSFLPGFKGAKPYHQAHERGVKIIGVTGHYATEDLDEGPIIDQDVVRVSHRDTVEDLIRKGRDLEVAVLARAVRAHLEHRVLVYGRKTVVFG